MATASAPPPSSSSSSPPWPIYDLFLDLPHPDASSTCPGPFLIPSPVKNPVDLKTVTVPQVTRFAFPEFAVDAPQRQQQQPSSANLNRYDMYAMQNPFTQFSHFTFSLQLETGVRLHGHVRRYMPPHLVARTRYDVGRRGERALVLLTRATGADSLFSAILKSIEAISSQQAALSAAGKTLHSGNPQQWFLQQLSRYQQYLSQVYASQQAQGKPLLASISGLELGDHLPAYQQHDVHRFLIPPALLQQQDASSPNSSSSTHSMIVPLLRCIGVPHTLRLLSALLSERRVVLLSASPTRLTVCSQAAIALLGAGALNFHHVYIPVLPPHLSPYLAAPYPYLIGLLRSAVPPTDGLGEVVVIQLDTNTMETYNIPGSAMAERVPDLCAGSVDPTDPLQQQQVAYSCADTLANELLMILKNDKKVLFGDSLDKKVGEAAGKAKEAVKKTFFKLREKGRQYLRGEQGESAATLPIEEVPEHVDDSMASDYIFTEGCHNEIAEHEARMALACFYLALYGNPRTFLSLDPQQNKPVLDRKKFLQHHRYAQGSPLYQLLHNFCQTQMLEEYAMARTKDTGAMSPDASLFLQCMSYCAQHPEYFSSMDSTRRVVEQFAERVRGTPNNARQTAMMLTSKKAMDTDNSRSVALLIGECRESSCILLDVMSVIWLRLRDCKGLQWRHAYLALQLLRNLLYHGPLAAISEATDGLSKIRALKFYENSMRSQWSVQVREISASVYGLLVDRAKLFSIRRLCAERRRAMQSSTEPKLVRGVNTAVTTPFRNLHAMMHPAASSGTVVQIPPKSQVMSRGDEPQTTPPQSAVADLFSSLSVGATSEPNPFAGFEAPVNHGATHGAPPPGAVPQAPPVQPHARQGGALPQHQVPQPAPQTFAQPPSATRPTNESNPFAGFEAPANQSANPTGALTQGPSPSQRVAPHGAQQSPVPPHAQQTGAASQHPVASQAFARPPAQGATTQPPNAMANVQRQLSPIPPSAQQGGVSPQPLSPIPPHLQRSGAAVQHSQTHQATGALSHSPSSGVQQFAQHPQVQPQLRPLHQQGTAAPSHAVGGTFQQSVAQHPAQPMQQTIPPFHQQQQQQHHPTQQQFAQRGPHQAHPVQAHQRPGVAQPPPQPGYGQQQQSFRQPQPQFGGPAYQQQDPFAPQPPQQRQPHSQPSFNQQSSSGNPFDPFAKK